MAHEDPHPKMAAYPSPTSEQATGNAVELGEGDVLLPDFVTWSAGGLYVDTALMGDAMQMRRFVDRVFAGAYLTGLDYAALSRLLYPREPAGVVGTTPEKGMVHIADGIRSLAPERRELYKNVKSVDDGARIEYVFEPAKIERVVEVPIYGSEDENGQPVISGYEKQIRYEPTTLDVDEFVAAMWQKEVRSGIDIAAVRAAIASGRVERVDIARRIDPVAGADATVQEKTNALHRDDSPSILANGRVDLRQFKNRFPQVSAGTCLLQKQPRRFGVLGFETDGTTLEPEVPRDFELEDMAGVGTRVERTAKGEFLLAARDGFLNIDTKSHQISITEKIVNREGVSLRTTGNLSLAGDQYEEHGEVQERRVVEGKHMSFHADVFGSIVSNGGRVHLLANLAGGTIRNAFGVVQIDHRASRAVIEARDGEVQIGQAEGVTIVAGIVRIERAVACDIVADEVEIGDASGCTIAARRIRVARAGARREVETLLTVCIPDFAGLDKRQMDLAKEADELKQQLRTKQELLDARMAAAEIRNYLAADQRIRSGALKLTPAQEAQWRQAAQKLARPLLEIHGLQKDAEALKLKLADQNDQLAALNVEREQAGADIRCAVEQITGDVAVQAVAIVPGVPVFAGIEVADIKQKLRDPRAVRQRLFRGDSGSFSWAWKKAAES